jgi:dTMP kinase
MGGERDRIEREDDGFHARAAAAYRTLAAREPGRYLVLDGTAPPDELAGCIAAAVAEAGR